MENKLLLMSVSHKARLLLPITFKEEPACRPMMMARVFKPCNHTMHVYSML